MAAFLAEQPLLAVAPTLPALGAPEPHLQREAQLRGPAGGRVSDPAAVVAVHVPLAPAARARAVAHFVSLYPGAVAAVVAPLVLRNDVALGQAERLGHRREVHSSSGFGYFLFGPALLMALLSFCRVRGGHRHGGEVATYRHFDRLVRGARVASRSGIDS